MAAFPLRSCIIELRFDSSGLPDLARSCERRNFELTTASANLMSSFKSLDVPLASSRMSLLRLPQKSAPGDLCVFSVEVQGTRAKVTQMAVNPPRSIYRP